MRVNDYEVPDGLYYTKEHEWLKVEGEKCRFGITDYAQKALHEIVFVDLPKVGVKLSQMESAGAVESVKAVADLYSPISGEVVDVNRRLEESPELVNQSPYGEGWIGLLKPSSLEADLKALMDATSYGNHLKKIIEEK